MTRLAKLLGALAALVLTAVPAAAAAADPVLRCSKIVFSPTRGEREVAFVGAALPDTARAGAADVTFEVRPGADRDAIGAAVHGQLVAVESLDRHARALLPDGAARVLVVPWAYGGDCTRYAWDGTARWAPPGTRGLFLGGLRDRRNWAGDIPTIDVFTPFHVPYTGRPRSARDTATALTPDELLSLYDALPGPGADPAARRDAARAWARANPALVRRRPASTMFFLMRGSAEAPRFTNAASPLLGTWRLDASLDGGRAHTGWLRTWDRTVHAEVEQPTPAALAADPVAAPRVVAYLLFAAGDTARVALPGTARPFRLPRGGYVRIAVPDERAPLDVPPWRGALEVDVLAHAFASDPPISAFLRAAETAQVVAYRPDGARAPTAVFTRDADGTLRVEQRIALADGRTLIIRGVRVSDAVIRDAPPDR